MVLVLKKEISKRGISSQFQDLQTKDMLTLFSQYEKLRADLSEGGREAQHCSSSSRTQEGGPDYHCWCELVRSVAPRVGWLYANPTSSHCAHQALDLRSEGFFWNSFSLDYMAKFMFYSLNNQHVAGYCASMGELQAGPLRTEAGWWCSQPPREGAIIN